MDSGSRSTQGAGHHCREFPGASCERAATRCRDRHERKDNDYFRRGCDCEGLRGEDRLVRNDRVPHAARRLSSAKHDSGIGRPAGIFCGDSRCRRKVRGARSQFAFAGTGADAPEVAVLNADDEFGKRLAGLAKKTVTYGLESDADITTKKFQLTFDGLMFTAHTPNGKVHVVSRLVGRINIYNLLAAIGAAQALDFSNEIIENGIRNLESVSGRFQRIDLGQPFQVIVDYAHTDDALENLIRTARELNPNGRIITLFGCG